MSFTRILCNLVGRSATYALNGAIAGSIGASVMDAANHPGYSVLGATRSGAAGGAIVGPSMAILTELARCCGIEPTDYKIFITEVLFAIGSSTLSGVIGQAMLKEISEMSLENTAKALAVGSSTFIGSLLTLSLVGGCCVCIVGTAIGSSCVASKAKGHGSDYLRKAGQKVGSFFASKQQTDGSESGSSMEEGQIKELAKEVAKEIAKGMQESSETSNQVIVIEIPQATMAESESSANTPQEVIPQEVAEQEAAPPQQNMTDNSMSTATAESQPTDETATPAQITVETAQPNVETASIEIARVEAPAVETPAVEPAEVETPKLRM